MGMIIEEQQEEQEEVVVVAASCILRSDVLQIRQAIRLEVESRSHIQRISDGLKKYFGFRTHCKVLLRVLNHAVDLIDEASGIRNTKGRKGHLATSFNNNSNDPFPPPPSNINTLKTNNYE